MAKKDYYRESIRIFSNEDKTKKAIFNIKDNKRLSKWWKNIYMEGYVNFKDSTYYIVQRNDNKKAIFDINDKENPITKWHDDILYKGLKNDEFLFYQVYNKKLNKKTVYSIKDKSVSLFEFVDKIDVQEISLSFNKYYYIFTGFNKSKFGEDIRIFQKTIIPSFNIEVDDK